MEVAPMFKKGFFLGRLIWIRGVSESATVVSTRRLLGSCNIQPHEVWFLTPVQFISLLSGGLDRKTLSSYEVLLVQGLGSLAEPVMRRFLSCLSQFKALQMGLGVRVVLVSNQKSVANCGQIHAFSPIVLDLDEPGRDPGDLNARVHALIEQASRSCQIPIRRITARAADLLEDSVVSGGNPQELLRLLSHGIKRSQGGVLRFRDLHPSMDLKGGSRGCVETHCN